MKTRALVLVLALLVIGLVMTHDPPMRRSSAQTGGPGIIPLVNVWNAGSVTSGSAVLASNFKTGQAASSLRISVVLGSTQPLAIFTTDGTHTFTSWLNSGTALTGGQAYTFVFGARNSAAPGGVGTGPTGFNFVVGGPTTVPILWVDEVVGGVD